MAEKITQLRLTSEFFTSTPKGVSIADIANAQMLVSTLGAVHALANPLDTWQSIKGIFAFAGNRKGQLTPRLNVYIFKAITATCAPGVAATVKEHILQRSKQVKAGIRAQKGKRRFDGFGQVELAAFAGTSMVKIVDLAALSPGCAALNATALDSYVNTYRLHRRTTQDLEHGVRSMLREMVNPVDNE
jgi:hypothetical protein